MTVDLTMCKLSSISPDRLPPIKSNAAEISYLWLKIQSSVSKFSVSDLSITFATVPYADLPVSTPSQQDITDRTSSSILHDGFRFLFLNKIFKNHNSKCIHIEESRLLEYNSIHDDKWLSWNLPQYAQSVSHLNLKFLHKCKFLIKQSL